MEKSRIIKDIVNKLKYIAFEKFKLKSLMQQQKM